MLKIILNLGRRQLLKKPPVNQANTNQSVVLNIDNQNQRQNTIINNRQNDLMEKPLFCFHKCKNDIDRCSSEPLYTVDQLRDEQLVNKRSLEDELQRHGHPTSRLMPKTKKQRKIEEGKLELLNHYRYVHDLI